MYLSDKFVFIDLPKTGCSHIYKVLDRFFDGRRKGTHVAAPQELIRQYRHVWGSIRNPWNWYLSLWAYGCDQKGTLYQALTSDAGWLSSRGWKHSPLAATASLFSNPRAHRRQWLQVYSDIESVGNFHCWLNMVMQTDHAKDLGDAFAAHELSNFTGLLTYRYLKLYCHGSMQKQGTPADLVQFENQANYITRFIRTEHLEEDLFDAMASIGKPLNHVQRDSVLNMRKTNTSSKKKETASYYDEDTIALVADRDQLIVKRFGFTAPPLQAGPG